MNTQKQTSISLTGAMIHDAKRLGKIISILSKYGLGALFGNKSQKSKDPSLEELKNDPSSTADKIRRAIEELGTTYIKFGQMLSTRSDLLPKAFIDELSKLQDTSPELPFETVIDILNEHYGDWHEKFDSIEEKPLGSASIAQVHRAVLKNGEHIVIKVQRPNLLPLIRSDVDILRKLAEALDFMIEEVSYFDLPALIDEFERTIVDELDFNRERSNIHHFMTRYKDNPMFVFPMPCDELSDDKVLVMQELEGNKITTVESDTPHAHKMAHAILELAFDMIFKDGIFHGDPHPGNVFAMPDGRIALLDFGAVGMFSPRQRELMMRIIMAANLGDCGMIARTLMSLGHPTKRVVLADLENDISTILQRHLKTSLSSIDVAQFAHDFVSAGQKYAIRIPSEFSCAVRALLSIEGIIQYLEPKLNVMNTLAEFAHKLITSYFTKDGLTFSMLQLGLNTSDLVRSIPLQVSQIMQDLDHDGLNIHIPENANDPLSDSINSAVTRLCLTLMFLGLTAFTFISSHPRLFMLMCIFDVFWCLILLRWHILTRRSKKRLKVTPFLTRAQRRKRWF